MYSSLPVCILFGVLVAGAPAAAAQLEVVDVPGVALGDNPLGDPIARPLAILSPPSSSPQTSLPTVIYLPGWGGSSQDVIADQGASYLGRVVDDLARKGISLRIAVPDGRSRYGGSQFLNSTATGRYADYITEEIPALLTKRYRGPEDRRASFIIAGHSSGGYGALMAAMAEHNKFSAVVALSPDSDFETTHKPLAQDAAIKAVTADELRIAMGPKAKARLPQSGLAALIMGLCANYAPEPAHPGHFLWLYDASGKWQPTVWQRWLEADPLTRVRQRSDAFAPGQRVYLDGAEHDEFGANIGARKMYEILISRSSPVTFREPAGHHADNLATRLEEGLAWALSSSGKSDSR